MTTAKQPEQAHRQLLGAIAAGLALMAAIAGYPDRPRASTGADLATLAGMIERQEDHVTALELAGWIRDRKPGLRIADLRTQDEFDEYHIPSAEPMVLSAITAMKMDTTDTWVLYSGDAARSAQAWALMRASGHQRVYFLRGGIVDWAEKVMNPVLPLAVTAEARRTNEHVAELSRYFGGVPRVEAPGGDAEPHADSMAVSRAAGPRIVPGSRRGAEPAGAAEKPAVRPARADPDSNDVVARTRRRGC